VVSLQEAIARRDYAAEESAAFEDKLRTAYGLAYRYEAARLLIGRSLAEPSRPDPLPRDTKFHSRAIPGENLFGTDDDLWLSALILDGQFGADATVDDLRALTEAHWARGYDLVRDELDRCGGNEIKLVQRLAEWLPEPGGAADGGVVPATGVAGEIRLKVGSVSRTHPADKPVDFLLNAPGIPPHIALMGAIGKGKTTTGVQIALELTAQARIPFLFIDPKGEFVADGRPIGPFAGALKCRSNGSRHRSRAAGFSPSCRCPADEDRSSLDAFARHDGALLQIPW
jgi:hypothetical protein